MLCFCVNSLFLFKSGSPRQDFKMLPLTAGKMGRGYSCFQWDFSGVSFRVAALRGALRGQSVRVFCVLRLPSQFRFLLATIAVPSCGVLAVKGRVSSRGTRFSVLVLLGICTPELNSVVCSCALQAFYARLFLTQDVYFNNSSFVI